MSKTEINVDSGGSKLLTSSIVIIILVLIGALTYFIYGYEDYKDKYHEAQSDNVLLSSSISELNDSVTTYRVKLSDGQYRYVGRINTLSMTRDNIEKLYEDKVNECKRIGIKLSSVKSITTAATQTSDSVILPVYVDSLKYLHTSYDDGYLAIANTIYRDNTSKLIYQYRDSFDLINDVKHKHFLFFKWKKKTSRYTLVPKNPKTHILNLKVIERLN